MPSQIKLVKDVKEIIYEGSSGNGVYKLTYKFLLIAKNAESLQGGSRFIILWNISANLYDMQPYENMNKDGLWNFHGKQSQFCLHSMFPTEMHCVYSEGITNMLNAFLTS